MSTACKVRDIVGVTCSLSACVLILSTSLFWLPTILGFIGLVLLFQSIILHAQHHEPAEVKRPEMWDAAMAELSEADDIMGVTEMVALFHLQTTPGCKCEHCDRHIDKLRSTYTSQRHDITALQDAHARAGDRHEQEAYYHRKSINSHFYPISYREPEYMSWGIVRLEQAIAEQLVTIGHWKAKIADRRAKREAKREADFYRQYGHVEEQNEINRQWKHMQETTS